MSSADCTLFFGLHVVCMYLALCHLSRDESGSSYLMARIPYTFRAEHEFDKFGRFFKWICLHAPDCVHDRLGNERPHSSIFFIIRENLYECFTHPLLK